MSQGKEHVPDLTSRAKVTGFACAGFKQPMIATYLGICEDTLVKHYAYELLNARMEKLESVAKNAFCMALEGSEKMTDLILRTHLQWVNPKQQEDDKKDVQTALMEKLIDKL